MTTHESLTKINVKQDETLPAVLSASTQQQTYQRTEKEEDCLQAFRREIFTKFRKTSILLAFLRLVVGYLLIPISSPGGLLLLLTLLQIIFFGYLLTQGAESLLLPKL